MDMEKFIKSYFESIEYEKIEDGYVVTMPILYSFADENVSIFFKLNNEGNIVVSDMGKTLEYFDSLNLDRAKYGNLIKKLCNRYNMKIEDDCLTKVLSSFESNQTMRSFHAYLGVLNFIANLNIFED